MCLTIALAEGEVRGRFAREPRDSGKISKILRFEKNFLKFPLNLVAPDCAIPRDYLSDAPYCALGFLLSQHGQLGATPPAPFLSVSPWRACEVEVRYASPQKGYLSDSCAIPPENKAMGAIPPSAILSRKDLARNWGGISHWAAKPVNGQIVCFSDF